MNYKDYIKAIMFDFDGTLIDFNYKASDYTIKALNDLKDLDYKLVLASGRPCFLALKSFYDVFGEYPLDYIYGCNGSEFMDVKKNEVEILQPLKADIVRSLGEKLNHPLITLGIYDGQTFLVNKEVSDPDLIDWMNARWLTPIIFDYSKNDVDRSKVLALSNPKDRKQVVEVLDNTDLSDVSAFFSSHICFEIAPKGVSKAVACTHLAKTLNIDVKQILSFGDMENDLDMLKTSTGVAMNNASEEIKRIIPLHTDDVDKKGIYAFLKENDLI